MSYEIVQKNGRGVIAPTVQFDLVGAHGDSSAAIEAFRRWTLERELGDRLLSGLLEREGDLPVVRIRRTPDETIQDVHEFGSMPTSFEQDVHSLARMLKLAAEPSTPSAAELLLPLEHPLEQQPATGLLFRLLRALDPKVRVVLDAVPDPPQGVERALSPPTEPEEPSVVATGVLLLRAWFENGEPRAETWNGVRLVFPEQETVEGIIAHADQLAALKLPQMEAIAFEHGQPKSLLLRR
ncbi:MAG: hypothetical protein KDD44_06340 [Bdellovibrionales bacterium]|nr:hypothetical protein [Bdellovibrionales bacterium]